MSELDELKQEVAELKQGHNQLVQKHESLVRELQTLLNQAMNVDPARAQEIRARAVKLARLRNAQT